MANQSRWKPQEQNTKLNKTHDALYSKWPGNGIARRCPSAATCCKTPPTLIASCLMRCATKRWSLEPPTNTHNERQHNRPLDKKRRAKQKLPPSFSLSCARKALLSRSRSSPNDRLNWLKKSVKNKEGGVRAALALLLLLLSIDKKNVGTSENSTTKNDGYSLGQRLGK